MSIGSTYVRCDSCKRRYPVVVVSREDNYFMPRGWTRTGTNVCCKKCSSKNYKTSQIKVIKNSLVKGIKDANI